MRWGAALLLVQIGCLESPADPGAPLPACASFGEWEIEPATVLDGVSAVSPTVTADQALLLYETLDGAIGIADRTDPEGQFVLGDPMFLSAINSGDSERNPTLSSDGLTVWFTRGSRDATELFVSHRDDRDDPFPVARRVNGLEGIFPEGPDVWDSGQELVYSIGTPDHELAHASCPERDACSHIGVLGVGGDGSEWFPTIRGDGLEMVYRSDLEGGMLAAQRDDAGELFQTYDPLDFVGDDPELSADGRALYYAASEQIYLTTRSCLDGQ